MKWQLLEASCELIVKQVENEKTYEGWVKEHFKLREQNIWISPSKDCVDLALHQCLHDNGGRQLKIAPFFIEAGANNGIRQSNSFNAEICYGYSGILVEPIKYNFIECKRYRPKSVCINAVLGNHNDKIIGQFADDLITVRTENDNGLGSGCTEEHLESYPELAKEVEMITFEKLNVIFDVPKRYAFLSLDVEGFENLVINEQSFANNRPNVVLIETKDTSLIKKIENQGYRIWHRPNDHDIIFKDIL